MKYPSEPVESCRFVIMHSPLDATAYLHRHIPITEAMRLRVELLTPTRVRLSAPLAPNINHSSTAFGGSIASAAVLACWSLINFRLHAEGLPTQLVVQRSECHFIRPVDNAFHTICELPDDGRWDRFFSVLQRKSTSRIQLDSTVHVGERRAAYHSGTYVALGSLLDADASFPPIAGI